MIDSKIAHHKGRTVKSTGDSMRVEFASAVEAGPRRRSDANGSGRRREERGLR
jgi:class 3 adenylate cyclase